MLMLYIHKFHCTQGKTSEDSDLFHLETLILGLPLNHATCWPIAVISTVHRVAVVFGQVTAVQTQGKRWVPAECMVWQRAVIAVGWKNQSRRRAPPAAVS